MLWNMVANLIKGQQCGASNQVQLINSNYGRPREEEKMPHLLEDVEIVKDLDLVKATLEETTNHHSFC
jgi:hypothetical protein